MDISVIIVNYNVSSFLNQTLTTLKEALSGISSEVIVVDNASKDDSVEMVKTRHPWARLIVNKVNLGFGKANNIALREVKGHYVLILNPDTVLRRDTIKTMINFMEEHKDAGIAGCKVLNPDGSLQLACRRGFPTPGVAFFKMVGLSDIFPKSKTFGGYNLTYLDPEKLSEVDAVSGSFMMVRKDALDRAGYFDEDFFMYGEDLDLCYRIKKDGWKIYYVPFTEIIHFKGESTKSISPFKSSRDFYKAMLIFVKKHNSGKSFPEWLLNIGIYSKMFFVFTGNFLKNHWQPLTDLTLINISLILGILLRFGISLERAPNYTQLQWLSIFVVYSTLYMTTFYFIGIYDRYKGNPERALIGIFFGFLFNVFIIYFIKNYNFSRIASFYCWGFNSILVSGWRFAIETIKAGKKSSSRRKTIIAGTISDAITLRDILSAGGKNEFDIIGCIEISADAIRGIGKDGMHVLGLVDEIGEIIKEYSIDVVLIAGSSVPFSRILVNGKGFKHKKTDFKLVPELKTHSDVENKGPLTMIDIYSTGIIEGRKNQGNIK